MNFDFDKTIANQGQTPSSNTELPYEKLGGYKLIRHLGDGGMGRVYLAEHIEMQRPCALKLLPKELSKKTDFVNRFKTEAKVLASLDHPNIVSVYNFGQSQGEFFLEMEYVDGGDLQDFIHRAKPEERAEKALKILQQILEAIRYAHQQNVIHRDLKPGNVLLRSDGTIKISDFGLATVVGEEYHKSLIEKSITLSQMGNMPTMQQGPSGFSNNIAGTILYMSPQAIRGEEPTPRDDLYAVGVMAYYLLTGRTPNVNFRAASKINSKLNRNWDIFISKCLEEETKDRYPDATAALAALAKTNKSGHPVALTFLLLFIAVGGLAGYHYAVGKIPHVSTYIEQADSQVRELIATFEKEPAPAKPAPTVEAPKQTNLPVTITVEPAGSSLYLDGQLIGTAPFTGEITFSRQNTQGPWENKTLSVQALGYENLVSNLSADLLKDGALNYALKPIPVPKAPVQTEQLTEKSESPALETTTTEVAATPKIQPKPANPFLAESFSVPLPNGSQINFRRIEPGEFFFGTESTEKFRNANEQRSRKTIAKPFAIATTEITQAQYKAIMNINPSNNRFDSENHPVEQVTWNDVAGPGGFIEKYNSFLKQEGITGIKIQLPTEVQWEYACRAGTDSDLNNGASLNNGGRDPNLDQLAVYLTSKSAPVASKEPNQWGLHDMHGNVWEWTAEGTLRGGSFKESARYNRSASRKHGQQNTRAQANNGFRIAIEFTQ